MAGQAGLGGAPQQTGQAGLGEAPMTMGERYRLSRAMMDQGYSTSDIRTALGMENAPPPGEPGVEVEEPTVGVFGDLGYGLRTAGESFLSGAGEIAEDQLGWDGASDALGSLAAYVGPSEAQEEAQRAEAEYRQQQVDAGEMSGTEQFAREAGDAIVESTPGMLGVLAAGWAGAQAGAAGGAVVGSVIPGAGTGAGAVVGGILGGLGGTIAASFPMMYDEQLKTAEANGLSRDDPEVQNKALGGAAFNTALDTIVPLKILGKINKTGAADIAQRAIAKRGAKDFIKDGITEGATEVAQMATGAILFDPNVAKLAKEDRAALFPYVMQKYGREIAMNFIAGAGLGGPLGGVAGMREQALANAEIKVNAEVLSKAAETTGAPIEGIRDVIKTPEGAKKVAQAAGEIQLAEAKRQSAKKMLTDEPTPERQKAFEKVESEADAVYDKWMPEFGGRKLTEVKAERKAVEDIERSTAFTKLREQGLKPKKDASYEAVTSAASKVEKAATELKQVEERLTVAVQPKQRQRVQADYDTKVKELAKAKAEAARAVGDESVTEASVMAEIEKGRGREKAVERDLARNYPKWMTPEQQVARAEETIAKSKENPDAEIIEQHKRLAAKQAKLLPESAEYARVQTQIDRLGDRMGGTSPAVEAAQRVLQRFGKGSPTAVPGSSPGSSTPPVTEAAADVKAGEGGAGPKPSPATVLTPEDVPAEMVTRLSDARAASKADPARTGETEAVARELLEKAGAEPSQANVDILIKGKGVLAKRLAKIPRGAAVATARASDAKTSQQLKAGFDIVEGEERFSWQHLIGVVDPDSDITDTEQALRGWTSSTGKEASATFDDDGNLLGAGTNNDNNGIMPPSNGWGTTASVMTHTHPEETPFSMADVLVLATSPALKAFRAVTPSQAIEMRPTDSLRAVVSEDDIRDVVRPVSEWLYENLPFDTRVVSTVSAARILQEAQLRHLARAGMIEYTAPMTGLTPTEEDYINGAVEAAAAGPQPRRDDRGRAAPGQEVAPPNGRDDTGSDRLSGLAASPQARGRDPVYPDFHAAWRAGTPNEDLIQRPEFVSAVGRMLTQPLTSKRPGFNTPQWHATRVYTIDGVEVVGTAAAMDAFIEQAANLAANELKLPLKPIRSDRILTILTGPPASGKSTIANEIAYSQSAAILDSDEFKKALPEFGDGSGANAVHTESKVLADAVEDILMAEGANIVYPKVGHEAASIQKLGRRFKAAGYAVNFVNLDVPPQTAMQRMLGRFGMTGRLIPPSYLLEEVSDNPSRVHNELEREGEFDGYARLDGLAPYGRAPDVLSQTGNPLAGTDYEQVPGGSPAERGRAAAQPGNAGDRGPGAGQAAGQPLVARGIDEAQDVLEAEGIGETRGVRGRSRVDREALRSISSSVIEWAKVQPKRAGVQPPFLKLAADGGLTVENLSKATDALVSGIAASSGHAMIKAGGILSPAASQQQKLAIGLGLANALSAQGKGRFEHRTARVWDPAAGEARTLSTLTMNDKLKTFFNVKALGFLPPMADPTDTSQIKLDGARNLMSGPALERAEATARMLQAQRYTIDQDAVAAIVANPDVLISKKSRGGNEVLANSKASISRRLTSIKATAEKITRAEVKALSQPGLSNYNLDKVVTAIRDAASALTLEDLGYRAQRAPLNPDDVARGTARLTAALQGLSDTPPSDPAAREAFRANPVSTLRRSIKSAASDNLGLQREKAKQKAARLKEYADGAVGREIGFRYGIDKKGRLYPDGEFHHQSGDAIKAIFRSVDAGMSLGDMDSFDHTGSGWQIAALIARDATIAARVNITGGMASNPNPPKGDIYTGVVGKIVARIERDIAAGDQSAIFFRDAIMLPLIEERVTPGKTFADVVRPDFKTPVIAVNYGGSDRQFREALINAYSDKLRGEVPPPFWSYFEDVGGEAIRSEAPDVMRFKEWSIGALEMAVRTAVGKGINPATLAFTVGPDALYAAVKKKLQNAKQIEAQDTREGVAIPSVSVVIREPVAPEDPLKGIDYAKTAKNIFSQIIQGYDAAVMHDAVARYQAAVPGGFMATNHDSYTIPDENRQALATAVNEALFAMIEKGGNVGERLRQEIIAQVGIDPGEPPALGSYNLEDVRTSMPVWREGKDGAPDSPMSTPAPVVARGMDRVGESTEERDLRWEREVVPYERLQLRRKVQSIERKMKEARSKAVIAHLNEHMEAMNKDGRKYLATYGKYTVEEYNAGLRGPNSLIWSYRKGPQDPEGVGDRAEAPFREEYRRALDMEALAGNPTLSRGIDEPRRTPVQVGDTGTRLENNLSNSFALAATKQYRTGRDLKLDLDARSRAAQAEQGIDLTTFTPETAERLSDFAVEDALEALQDNANAVGWYDDTVTRALAELEQLHPELKTDKAARLKFIWALAVTSNGIKVDRNFQMANIAYEYSKEGNSTTFPTDLGAGDAARAINGGLRMYDVLLERMGSVDALLEFMTTKRPVREIEKISGVSVSGEGKGEMVYGAAILGPKIGNGFFANLYGNFDALTMDRWLMRSVGRWRGTLVTPNEPMIAAKREGLKALIKSLTPAQMKYLQGFFNGSPVKVKKIISVPEIDAMAAEIAKRSMAPSWRENLSQTSEGNQMRLLGNALTGYLDGQNEAPGGATERTFLRKVFGTALERLRAMPGNEALTMADLQALLWYPERRLYDAAKSLGDQQKGYADDEAPDYANAARKLVRDRLGPDAGGGSGAGGSGPRADAGAPAVARGADGPDVRQRRARAGDYGGSPRPARPDERVAGGPVRSVREFDDGRHVYETDAATFSRAMSAARVNLGPVAAQVGDDTGDRQFLLDGGATGFALSGNDIISVFSTPGVSQRGAAARMLQAAVAEGGQTLNAFDTFLPQLYAKSGFRSVARLPFNREYAPEGWDYDFFREKYGTDEPDVIFMVYDPESATSKTDNVIGDYDEGLAAQAEALRNPVVARGMDRGVAQPSPEIQFRLSNTVKRPSDRVANVRHELTPYDADIALAIVLDRGRYGPIMKEVQANNARLMRGYIEGTSMSRADRRDMMLAVDQYERQKLQFSPSFRPMDAAMARDIFEQMGALLNAGRLDEARIARQLGYTREKAAAVAKQARAAVARSAMPQPARGMDIFSRFFPGRVTQQEVSGATSTPEFKSWFSGSKIVDEAGKPQVVYYGAQGGDTEALGTSPGRLGEGISLTTKPGLASRAATSQPDTEGANVIPVFAKVTNPLIIRTDDPKSMDKLIEGVFSGLVEKFGGRQHDAWLIRSGSQDRMGEARARSGAAYDRANRVIEEISGAPSIKDLMAKVRYPKKQDRSGPVNRIALRADAQPVLGTFSANLIPTLRGLGIDGIAVQGFSATSLSDPIEELVVFEPTQVKSVFNQGAFSPTDPAISRGIDRLFRPQPVSANPLPGLSNPGAETAFATAQRAAQDGSLLRRIGRGIERQVFNKQAGLKQIERAVGADSTNVSKAMSRMAQMMTASSGRVAAMLQYGAPKWDPNEKVFTYAPGTKGLAEIFKFTDGDDYQRFQGWAYAKRDRGLMARGKGARMTDALRAQYEAIPTADKLRYDDMLDEYRKFNEAMLDLMVDSGLISATQRAALSQDQEYVPMFRAFEDASEFGMQGFFGKDGGFSHPDPGIRKLLDNPAKVGEPNGGVFGDLIEGIHSGAIAALHAAQQNIGHAQIYDFMTGNLGHEVKTIKAATGIEVRTLGRDSKKKAFNAFEQDAVKFFRDGKEVFWKATGKNTEMTNALQMALAGLQPRQLDGLDRALKAFNSFQRTVITSTPGFALASVARDVGQTYVQSGTRINEVLRNNAQQFREAFAGASQGTKDLMMAAGVGGYQMQGMPENDAQSFRRKIKAQSNTLWSNANRWLSNYERVLGSTELGARAAVAESITRKGGSKADAAYEALNMIDYNRAGGSPLVQRLLYMVLFLNPRLQGLYRLFEDTKGNSPQKIAAVSASVLARGLVLTGVAMTARMMTAMDEEDEEAYGNLSTSDRASYLHIPLPGTNRFLKLPQPFEIGAVFSTLPVQVFDSMYSSTNGMNDLGRMVGHTFVNTFSLNPVPQAVMPLVELYMNKNMFNGMPIEGQRLEGLPKELRIDLSTGGIAQFVGNKTLSPVQVQHILDGYLGPLGSFLFSAVEGTMAGAGLVEDKATASDGAFGSLPAPLRGAAKFTVGRFISATDAERSTQFVTQFYDLSNSVKQYTAAINEAVRMGDLDEARRLVEDNRELLRFKPMLAKVSRSLTELNKQLRFAQFSPTLTPEERQRRIDILNTKKNQLVRAAVEKVREGGQTGSFAGGLIGMTT